MYCYNIYKDLVVSHTLRKQKYSTNEELAQHIEKLMPHAKAFTCSICGDVSDLYKLCCSLSDMSEDTIGYNWFASKDTDTVKAVAVLAVIEQFNCWEVLQSREAFDTWIQGRIR